MFPFSNYSGITTQSMNSLLLSSLLAKEMNCQQNQELIQQTLYQQINPTALLEKIEKNRNQSKETISESSNRDYQSAFTPIIGEQHTEIKDQTDTLKYSENNCKEMKDEIETIQSSDEKTGRNRSISDDTSNISRKISLKQAYHILNQNSILDTLIQTFSSSN